MIFPQILSINSTKLSTIAWAKENAGIAVVPASPGEIFDNDLICKITAMTDYSLIKRYLLLKDVHFPMSPNCF
jgi:hypothetical protein